MKNKCLKIISIIITALLLVTFMTVISKAENESSSTTGNSATQEEDNFLAEIFEGNVVDGVVGILLTPLKIFIIIFGTVIRAISGGIALIGGATSFGNFVDTLMLSPEDIIFNEISITNIDIFDFSVSGPILTIRENIAKWYYGLRVLAVVILLVIFIYIGLRMALSTVAEEEAKYKKMLTDWIISFILVFLLHYIIIFTISINNGLVDIFSKSLENTTKFGTAIQDVLKRSLNWTLSIGLGSAMIYLLLCALTFIFLVMYIKRMLTVSFLVIIAPIITITYSIDKMGDGKSQALNTWLKEFVYNILIQPFHCIIYLVFGAVAVNLMNGTLSSSVLAICMIIFILQAEKIIKNIFGFNAKSMSEGLVSAAAIGAGALAISKNLGSKGSAKATGSVGGSGGTPGAGRPPEINQAASAYSNSATGGSSGASGSSGTGSSGGAGGTGTAGSGGASGGTGGISPYSAPSGLSKAGGLALNKGGKMLKGYGKSVLGSQLRVASMMSLAAFGAVTGDLGSTIALGTAGGGLYDSGKNKINDVRMQKRIKANEEYFAGAYQDYARDTGMNEQELKDKTQQILEMDPEDIIEQDRAYAGFVYAMRDTYQYMGENDPKQKLLNTINEINNGNIKPKTKQNRA